MISQLDLHRAAGLAGQRGLPAVTAQTLAAHDLAAYDVDGVLAVAGIRTDPIVDRPEVHLPAVVVGDHRLGEGDEILRAVEAVCRHLGVPRAVVALPFQAAGGPGLQRAADYLDLPVERGPGAASAGLTVRDATEDDWAFVRTMLHRALLQGYATAEPDLSRELLDDMVAAYVEESFEPPDPEQVRAIVAVDAEQPAGHATWLVPAVDPISGRSTATLLDVAARPGHQGRGLRRQLVAGVVARLQGDAAVLRGQVVLEDDDKDGRLVDALMADGWRPAHSDFVHWVDDLGPTGARRTGARSVPS
jgi:GNAT superfamily N-acetyltransferase